MNQHFSQAGVIFRVCVRNVDVEFLKTRDDREVERAKINKTTKKNSPKVEKTREK